MDEEIAMLVEQHPGQTFDKHLAAMRKTYIKVRAVQTGCTPGYLVHFLCTRYTCTAVYSSVQYRPADKKPRYRF